MISQGVIGSVRLQKESTPCAQCGSTSRVGRGLCLKCLLYRGLGDETYDSETLESVLDEVDVRDADWRLGNYQILEEIGRGGMGVIYRARQRHSRRIVALKRILAYHADSRETLVRFRREAEAAASLDHPNILPIYEVGESDDGLPYFSMKLATGGSLLESHIALHKDPRRSVALMAKVSRAVQYAHAQGILHRDLKPGNILLDGRGEPMVSDFGLAKWLDTSSDLTRTLTIFGTPGYIAPEQAQGKSASLKPTADVYSLGAILFDLLARRPPFLGEHALSVIQQAAEKSAPRLRSLKSALDRDLETICARCLEREPTARYRSAGELAEDLERWLEGRPIVARPVSAPVRIWRWSKRNPKLASALAAAIILAVVGLVVTIVSSRLSSIVQTTELARHSVEVLPFEDFNEVPSNSRLAESVTANFIESIAHTKGLHSSHHVLGNDDPSTMDDWKRIGKASGARFLLSGSVRLRNGRERVVTHLIETASGSLVATSIDDVDSHSDFAKAFANKLFQYVGANPMAPRFGEANIDVRTSGGTANAAARSYYERGKEFFFRQNQPDLKRAIDSFQTALKLDPNYAQAYALFATACQHRIPTDPKGNWLEQSEKAAATALRIAPLLPEAHQALAGNLELRGRLRDSIDPHITAFELDPSDGRAAAMLGYIYAAVGRPDVGLAWFEKARRESQPLYADNIGDAWVDLGNYEKAENSFNTAAVFRPDIPVGVLGLTSIALYRGDFDLARKRCAEAQTRYADNPQPLIMAAVIEFYGHNFDAAQKLYQKLRNSNSEDGIDFLGAVEFESALGLIKQHTGSAAEGKALLEKAQKRDEAELLVAPDNFHRIYSLSANYAALSKLDKAVAALGKAVQAGWIDYRAIELDPRFDSIRGQQAFNNILTDLKAKVEEMRRHLPSRQLASTLDQ